MSWLITPSFYGFIADADAKDYLARVHAAEGQTLEPAVASAIEAFIVGCKSDGIWNAIKASCILAGARTLNGALVPLAGTAPTNFNFVAGDYNRKTGLVGNGSTKYLDSNRNNNADPQNSHHMSAYRTNTASVESAWILAASGITGATTLASTSIADVISIRSRQGTASTPTLSQGVRESPGLLAISRASSASVNYRWASASGTITQSSEAPGSSSIGVFANQSGGAPSTSRLAFYSIGEALDLALLNARVTALINAFGTAIP